MNVPQIPGCDGMTDWFGSWPSFHDAEILDLYLNRSGKSWVRIHVWIMTDKVDKGGYYVHERDAVVTFTMEDITDVALADFSGQNVIAGLDVARLENGYRLDLHPCYGLAGTIDARRLSVAVSPGKPPETR